MVGAEVVELEFEAPEGPGFRCWDKGLSIPECGVLTRSRLLLLGVDIDAPFIVTETGAAGLLLSSLSLFFLSSSSFNTIFNLPPSPSKTTFHSSSSLPFKTVVPMIPPFLPCSFSTARFACSCARYLMKMMPSAAPLEESICGSKDAMVP